MNEIGLAYAGESHEGRRRECNCPFYGFSFQVLFNLMISSGGNQCALRVTAHAPCYMEIRGKTPNFPNCPYNNLDNGRVFSKIANTCRVFPPETAVDNIPRGGISLSDWMKRFS